MIEIQCTSCHTRYRIDERVLPDETPTFKCSRCGHVFNAEPAPARVRKPSAPRTPEKPRTDPPSQPEPEPAPQPSGIESRPREAQPEIASERPPEADKAEPEENPLDRTFSRDQPEDLAAGQNLSFDFGSDPGPGETDSPLTQEESPAADDHWEVGELPPETEHSTIGPSLHAQPEEPAPSKPQVQAATRTPKKSLAAPEFREPEFTASVSAREENASFAKRSEIPDEVAFFTSRTPEHSAAWFLGLFAVIVIFFAAASLFVHIEPAPVARTLSELPRVGSEFQRPLVPAMLVALHDVHADYDQIKGGQTALLISGTAENVGGNPLHAVLLAVDLLDEGGRQIASGAAFCGNGLTAKMVGEMTPREIDFLQRLDPQKNFVIDPSHTAPFLLVFIDPPRKIANLRIQVAKAVAVQKASTPRS